MIDIQQWRMSIGSYIGKGSKVKHTYKFKNNPKTFYSTRGYKLFNILMVIFCINAQVNDSYGETKAKLNNKIMHITNGNIANKGNLKLLHINKGNSFFENKLDDMYKILDVHKPLMSI